MEEARVCGARLAYVDERGGEIEAALSAATEAAVEQQASRPIAFIAEFLIADSGGGAASDGEAARKDRETRGDDGWRVGTWMASTRAAAMLGRALLPAGLEDSSEAELEAMRALACHPDRRARLRALLAVALDDLVDSLDEPMRRLAVGEAATSAELQEKFSQDVRGFFEYSSLSAFFGGLEAKVGAPNPKVREAMAEEHTRCGDSDVWFKTSNYEMNTTSAIEWRFVAEPDAPPDGGWPVERKLVDLVQEQQRTSPGPLMRQLTRSSQALLESGAKPRRAMALEDLEATLAQPNAKLAGLKEPLVVVEEAMGARLYTGVRAAPSRACVAYACRSDTNLALPPCPPAAQPLFVKYNAVLRGLGSTVTFLRNDMIARCCPKDVAKASSGSAEAKGTLAFDDACAHLNTYTTTLHTINSAIVKLSKLTVATKVYRGVSGMALPESFWKANEYGVKGGIEGAFMSTTLDRKVAMQYASSSKGCGIVFEVQQGMVDRGAEIAFLSQYRHEKETLFGPLTGLEVRATRVEGSVLVVEVALSINLASLTIEQVLGKRRKVVADMCDQLAARARLEAQGEAWALLRSSSAVDRFLEERLKGLAREAPEHYNENAPLGDAIREAVALAGILSGWPEELTATAEAVVGQRGDGEKASMSVDELVRSEATLTVSPKGGKEDGVPVAVVHGLCALLWARPESAPLCIDLSERALGADGLAALGRAATRTLMSLNLNKTNCANFGGDNGGILQLGKCLADARASGGLVSLSLRENALNAEAAKHLTEGLKTNASLCTLKYAGSRSRPDC